MQNDSPGVIESIIAGNGCGSETLINVGEPKRAEEIVKSLLSPRAESQILNLQPYDFTAISPLAGQVNHLREVFSSVGLGKVNIGPLEAFQGLESRVVVICTTITWRDERDVRLFVRTDQARTVGLIGDKRKFNVVVTRARRDWSLLGMGGV